MRAMSGDHGESAAKNGRCRIMARDRSSPRQPVPTVQSGAPRLCRGEPCPGTRVAAAMRDVQPAGTKSAAEASDMNVQPVERANPKLELARQERARRRPRLSAEWLLDGLGFAWLRFVVDLIMLVLAVVAAIVGANAAKVSLDGEMALYAFPLLVVALLYV